MPLVGHVMPLEALVMPLEGPAFQQGEALVEHRLVVETQ